MVFKLNEFQKQAVEHIDGPALVTSCPGSGKTACVVERVANLIKKGVKPKNILCLTFTNKAANELKERVCKKLGVEKLDFFVGTFHSLCVRLLKKIGPLFGKTDKFTILDERDQSDLVMQIARQLEYNIEIKDARHISHCLNYYRDQMEDFEWVEDHLSTEPFIEIAQEYLSRCERDNLVDFSGLIYNAIKIVEKDEKIKYKVLNTFKYICVDEVQDSNVAQFHLVNLLGELHRNVMIIGDVDQCLTGDQEILTNNGYIKINDIKELDTVKCMKKMLKQDKYKLDTTDGVVERIYKKEVINYPIVKIKTLSNKEATFSKDHMVFVSLNEEQKERITKDFGELKKEIILTESIGDVNYEDLLSFEISPEEDVFYLVPAMYIEKGMKSISYGNFCMEYLYFDTIKKVEHEEYSGFLYDLDVGIHHNFISGSGVVSHNSIYGWRGARYQNIQNFIDRYEDCKVISLSKNYRSTPEIVKVAHQLIKYNDSHMGTGFETDNQSGEAVRCIGFNDQIKEAEWVGKMIGRLIDDGGWAERDIAVLYRVNKMSQPIEQSLTNNGIPYEVVGSHNFYDRKEIRDCLAMLKFLSNQKDGVAFSRVGSLLKGLGAISIGKIENRAQEKNITITEACREISDTASSVSLIRSCNKIVDIYDYKWDFNKPAQCLDRLIRKLDYNDYLLKKYDDTAVEREDNVKQLIDASGEFENIHEYLHNVSLITSADNKEDKEQGKVSLMSMHSSKGLEYPIIFIIGAEENIIPNRLAILDDPFAGEQEERRLMFVAATRAMHCLFILYCRNRRGFGKFGNSFYKKAKPSRFLYECGLLEEK